ncbi:MAG: cobalamin-independent methionine synthase II family protein [Candidatus Poribacteria bacterium]|nr:cobalamin-independent methionine synthase II family protein [Candidatus Poribacteria bacterium]
MTIETNKPRILTTTVGSYPVPAWLNSMPSEQTLIDATRVVVDIQRQHGIDLPTDGELYRFDVNHPDTNGMIDYFIRPLSGIRPDVGRQEWSEFRQMQTMAFRAKPAGVVENALGEGTLNLVSDCERAVNVAGTNIKFTVTSPYMLARTLLDKYYDDFDALLSALAVTLSAQVAELNCRCLQIDEANIPGNPDDGPRAAAAINTVLDAFNGEKAVHFCFGNYGGQVIQEGNWKALIDFLNMLRCDHLVLELKHRPDDDLQALKDVSTNISIGIGVIDVKVNPVETPDDVASNIEKAEEVLGNGRVGWVHPDCGFWMLQRSVVDRKIEALVKGRDKYLGIS